MGWFDKADPKKLIKKAIKEIEDEGKKVGKKLHGEFEKSVKFLKDHYQKDMEKLGSRISDIGIKGINEIEKAGKIAGKEAKDKIWANVKVAGEEIEKTSKVAGKEIEKAGKKVLKSLEKFAKSGAPEVLFKAGTPNSITISGQVVGNGIAATYADSEEVLDEVMEQIKKGKFNVDIMYHLLPDEITVDVGLELALVVSVDVGASITYNSQEDIRMIVGWFKKHT